MSEAARPPSGDEIAELLRVAADEGAALDARRDAIGRLSRVPPERGDHAGPGGDARAAVAAALEALRAHAEPSVATAAAAGLRRLSGRGALSFERVAVIGASVSAGFMGSPVATELDRGIAGRHAVENLADVFFFRAPQANGAKQVDAALSFEPSVVLALDFLFWYAYVDGVDLDQRRARLERGLRELERLRERAGVPVIVGDIPDMRTAATWMLPPEVVPPPEHLSALNQRLREWAAEDLSVHVVPLAAWGEPLLTGAPVDDQGRTVRASELLSADGLHLNERGVRYLLRRVDAELTRAFPDTPEHALRVAVP